MAILSTSNLYEPDIGDIFDELECSFGEDNVLRATGKLEKALCEYHQSEYCVSFSSGFWALAALILLKCKDSCEEVLMPSLTYRRLADVAYWARKKPVFVDIDKDTLAISPQAVRDNITDKTALILAVHPIVNCCDVDRLLDISAESGVPIIIDAVESVHETYRGKRVGSFGVGEAFSLHSCKLFNGMEGGYVCTNDEKLYSQLRGFRDRSAGVGGQGPGMSLPLNEVHAVFALQSLKDVESIVRHNEAVYRRYQKNLQDVRGIRILVFDESEQSGYKNIVVELLDDYPRSRDYLVSFLNERGVLARAYYCPPLHTKDYLYVVRVTDMTNTSYAANRYMNLPCGYRVSLADVDHVCSLIMEAVSG